MIQSPKDQARGNSDKNTAGDEKMKKPGEEPSIGSEHSFVNQWKTFSMTKNIFLNTILYARN